MKKLIFIRHGKAEDPASDISDFERSLTLKGKSICRLMAQLLKEKETSPGTMITSPAFRALETAYIFAGVFGIKPEQVKVFSNLYYKMNFHHLPEILSLAGEHADIITLFGHNPSFTEIAGALSRQGCDFLPKCGIVCLSFNIKNWTEISYNKGKIEYSLKPEKIL